MSDKERLVRFALLGQEYTFYTGASEEEMEEILSFVKKLIEEGSTGSGGTIPASKVAILACLNIASRYIKLREDFERYKGENENRACNLIDQIDASLLPEKRD
jgi:hypothetical protein